jgi:hypothetical protein
MATLYSPKIVTDGLIIALDAANVKSYSGSGTTWTDLSQNGRNGTLVNGPTFDSANGGNIVFDGTNDVVRVVNPTTVITADSPLTVSTWVKVNSSGQAIVDTINDSTTWDGWGLWANGPSNRFRWLLLKQYSIPGPAIELFLNSNTTWNGSWQHVTAVYTGTQGLIYINGILDASANYSGGYDVAAAQANIGIGARTTAAGPTNCNIAQVQVYNRALSATEVLQNFNATRNRFGV